MKFELKEKRYLKNIDSEVYLYKHKKTNAQLIYFSNTDVNKSFSISFKTIPYSDNGIFHILEHSVLCGSEKYPVKEPFVELIKGSFNTFINAMTFPDKTMYPVSSKNEEDLKILMDIYLDAVFNPKLLTNKNILKQEGWHYHLESKEDELIYKGVVYNEMKGVYSSEEELLDMYITKSLFKNSPYKYSYGGVPEDITTITQEEFEKTYNYCYHPSNSFITLYGDLDIDVYLEHIDNYLNKYQEKDYSNYKIDYQKNFTKEAQIFNYYNEKTSDNHYISFNYIIGKNSELKTIFSIDIIDELLLGNSNAEFKKYFIENNICEDVYGYIQRDRLEVVYSIIFKNIKDEYIDKIEDIYLSKLQEVIDKKFDKEQIKSQINKNKFIIKEEVNKTSSPKGVNYTVRTLRNWLYGENPFEVFDYDFIINALEENLINNNFENIAKKYILENQKQSIVKMLSTNEKTEENLLEYKKSLYSEQLESIIEDTNQLLMWQNSKDKKEDLEKIRSVDAKKVFLKNPYNKLLVEMIDNVDYIHYDINTNDIIYSKLLFDISSFDEEELQYAAILTYLMFNIDTKNKTALEVSKEIDFNLGNISSNIGIYKDDKSDNIKLKYIISAKNLVEKLSELVNIITENTLELDFNNKNSIYNILLELKLSLEYKFKNSGHSFINSRMASYYSKQMKLQEMISGFDFYEKLKEIVDNFDDNYFYLKEKLEILILKIFNKNNVVINSACSKSDNEVFKKNIFDYVNKLNSNALVLDNTKIKFVKKDINYSEAFYFDTLVQYVGLGANINYYSGEMLVLRHILSFDYLWNDVRVKGGAYGVGMTLNKYGDMGLWSYRDPNLEQTFNSYYNISNYIKSLDLDDTSLNKYIIGALNNFDQLMSPAEKANISLMQYLTNSDISLYDKLVDEIKNTTLEKLLNLANLFENLDKVNYKCVIASKDVIENSSEKFSKIIELK